MSEQDQRTLNLLVGMLYSLAGYFQHEFNASQEEIFKKITDNINKIYYTQPKANQPTSRYDSQ